MDPASLIATALAAGATAVAKDTVGQAVRDAYEGLKSLVKRKLAGRAGAEEILDCHELRPGADGDAALKEALESSGAGEDTAVMDAARRMVELADPEGVARGKYQLTVTGDAQGVVQGDHAQVTMTFGEAPKGE